MGKFNFFSKIFNKVFKDKSNNERSCKNHFTKSEDEKAYKKGEIDQVYCTKCGRPTKKQFEIAV